MEEEVKGSLPASAWAPDAEGTSHLKTGVPQVSYRLCLEPERKLLKGSLPASARAPDAEGTSHLKTCVPRVSYRLCLEPERKFFSASPGHLLKELAASTPCVPQVSSLLCFGASGRGSYLKGRFQHRPGHLLKELAVSKPCVPQVSTLCLGAREEVNGSLPASARTLVKGTSRLKTVCPSGKYSVLWSQRGS